MNSYTERADDSPGYDRHLHKLLPAYYILKAEHFVKATPSHMRQSTVASRCQSLAGMRTLAEKSTLRGGLPGDQGVFEMKNGKSRACIRSFMAASVIVGGMVSVSVSLKSSLSSVIDVFVICDTVMTWKPLNYDVVSFHGERLD